jgi:hypothetical protein
MTSSITDSKAFLDAFKSAGGWYDHETFGLSEFDQMGWGGIALNDIPVSLFPVYYGLQADDSRNIPPCSIFHWNIC